MFFLFFQIIIKMSAKLKENGLETEKIMGIGPKKAKEIRKKFGITKVTQLKKSKKAQELLSKEAKACLLYCPFPPKRYKRKEILTVFNQFKKAMAISNADKKLPKMELVGSYRRGKPDSGDIDILMTLPLKTQNEEKKKAYITELNFPTSVKWITSKTSGERLSFIYRKSKIDLFVATKDNYYEALVHWTGGEQENIIMRVKAKKKGMKFSQKGLYKGKKRIPIKSERDVYEKIGADYRKPTERR